MQDHVLDGLSLRSLYWIIAILTFTTLNVILFSAVRTQAYVAASVAGLWIVAVAWSTLQALATFTAIEAGTGGYEDAMRLALRQIAIAPVLGMVPVLLLLLP